MEANERTDSALHAAFAFLRGMNKTVLTELARLCGCSRRHLQAVVSPKEQKPMSSELARKIAAHYELTYEQFLDLGVCLLNGADGETALRSVRTLAARENPELRHVDGPQVRLPWGNAAQAGVNHGTVARVVQAAPAVPVAPVVGGDIARELCGLIAQHLEGKNMDQQIEFRKRVKALMDGEAEG